MGIGIDIGRAALRGAVRSSQASAQDQEAEQEAKLAAAEARAESAAEQKEAANLPRMLSESARYLGSYIAATPAQIDTLTLVAAVTHVTDPQTLVSVPRVLFTAKEPEAGKTHSAKTTLSLCYNPMDTTGTWYGVQSGIAEQAQQGRQCPTFFRDEISGVFGDNGLGRSAPQLADIIRQGYLSDATCAWSVNRQRVEFSTFSVFLMTGLRSAVPSDVRTRCIVINMAPGEPPQYYDLRDARDRAKKLAMALGRSVRGNRDFIREFRVRTIGHPKLVKRRGEVWEPLFAVAAAADAQSGTGEWKTRALAAFLEVALDENDQMTLSPDQEIIRDVAAAAELIELRTWRGEPFAGGKALREALRELDDDAYGRLSDDVLGCRMRDALTDEHGDPLRSVQVRFGNRLVRGYLVKDLLGAWDAIRPGDASEFELAEEPDPFADEDASGDEDEVIADAAA
jgi:hypothetical protein